jgi:hypothetical protein
MHSGIIPCGIKYSGIITSGVMAIVIILNVVVPSDRVSIHRIILIPSEQVLNKKETDRCFGLGYSECKVSLSIF